MRLQDRHGDIGLDAYMRLPVQHYYELDPGLIKPLGGSAFALKVPRVSVSLLFTTCAVSTIADHRIVRRAISWLPDAAWVHAV